MVWATLVRTISRTTFSKKWFEDRHLDFYAQKARKEGFRARSCYKLMEIDEKHNILHRNSVVVELGSAPGGWTQVAAKKVKTQHGGLIVALDRSEMDPVEGAIVLQMDFIKDDRKRLHDLLVGKLVDVVLSDMAYTLSFSFSFILPLLLFSRSSSLTLFLSLFSYFSQSEYKWEYDCGSCELA
jgi:23S rRNA (uridine2552-2'-O)-methyltransferase